MIAISFGGGTNSAALIIEALSRGLRPDLIVFADTGSEWPHTYGFVEDFEVWLSLRGLVLHAVRWVRVKGSRKGRVLSLHEECLEDGDLPAKAYGLSGCTSKYKQQVIDAFVKKHPLTIAAKERGETIERWLGYDADEDRGEGILEPLQGSLFPGKPSPWKWRAPLKEWGIDRQGCVDIIARAGLVQPGKSSCFLCPNLRKSEIFRLAQEYPALFAKALEIEDKARPNLRTVIGLGRTFSWRDLVEGKETAEESKVPPSCGCHDDSAQPDLFCQGAA